MIKVRKLKEHLTAVVQLAFDLVLGFDNKEGKQIWLLNDKKACGCVILRFFVQKN